MPNQNDERIGVNVSLPKWLDRAVEIEVAKRDITKRQFIEDAIRTALKGRERAA